MVKPARRKSIETFLKGGLDALDIEIDDLNLNPHLKDFLHNVVEGADKTISNALSDRKVLERASSVKTAYVDTSDVNKGEAVEQPIALTHDQTPVEPTTEDQGDFKF